MAPTPIGSAPGGTAGGLYRLKPRFVARLRGLEDRVVARGVTAGQLTWAGALAGAVTAAALLAGTRAPWLWLAVAPLSLIRMACNALDGAVARRTSTVTARGAVTNELADRAADLLTLAALAPVVGVAPAAAAAVVALATSFVAVLAQAVTGRRIAAGPLGKPDRVAVLSVGATAAVLVGPAALVAATWVIVAAGLLTVARRTVALWRVAGRQR
jgi:CDP-diacylglycerol---glycerol-3-phosphate 3-phosphatidyltransferase